LQRKRCKRYFLNDKNRTGIDLAKGDYIATMDGDNQDDPKDFIKMIKKLEKEDLDAVIGWRKNRWTGNFFRKFPSLTANKIMKID